VHVLRIPAVVLYMQVKLVNVLTYVPILSYKNGVTIP